MAKDVNLETIANQTDGFVGAQLAALVNDAAIANKTEGFVGAQLAALVRQAVRLAIKRIFADKDLDQPESIEIAANIVVTQEDLESAF